MSFPVFSSPNLVMKKTKGQYGFFDIENQLDKIYEINDFLPKLDTLIDWEMFRYDSLNNFASVTLSSVRRRLSLSNLDMFTAPFLAS